MPYLVSKQHEHHILLGVLMDLSEPCLITIWDKETRDTDSQSDKRKRHYDSENTTKEQPEIKDKKKEDILWT